MKEITITIPDNCELIKEGNTYAIKEKDTKPKSWREFCHNFRIKQKEYFIDADSAITKYDATERREIEDRNLCVNPEEAEAFLALMQLRQLRKAWVEDWEPLGEVYWAITVKVGGELEIGNYYRLSKVMSFPTIDMAEDFLNCFRNLCETAKIFL